MLKILQSKRFIQGVAILLILAGSLVTVRYTQRVLGSYRAIQFAVQNDFDAGDIDVDLLQPWMNIRYIAVGYAVSQTFLFDELGIRMTRPNSRLPLERLNNHLRLGEVAGEPALIGMVQDAILKYRADPVTTGLAEGRVQRWMSMQYIANSTGIPVETFFTQVGIPMEGHNHMPLEKMVDQANYEPGLDHLLDTLQRFVDENADAPNREPNKDQETSK